MSRPTIGEMAATETIQVRVTPAQRRELEQAARVNYQTASQFARDALMTAAAECLEKPIRNTKPQR